VTAADIQLDSALAGIEELDNESAGYLGPHHIHAWVWPIIIWILQIDHALTRPNVITMQLLPIMIKLTIRGALGNILLPVALPLPHAMLCNGELCALAWLPFMLIWLIFATTRPVPKEDTAFKSEGDKPKNHQLCEQIIPEQWCKKIKERVLRLKQTIASWMQRLRPNMQKSRYYYYQFDPVARKKALVGKYRCMACTLQLLVLTCLSEATFGSAHAFDLDSVSIAVDNCSLQSMTNSFKD
jgi:hypothetical protein